jgi:hypothetical protein
VQHSDPDVLALVALGERAPAADAEHLLECEQCRADVEELTQVVSAVRVDVTAGPAVAPPPRVWDGIAAATGVRTTPRPDQVRGGSASAPQRPTATPPPPASPSRRDELAARRTRRSGVGVRTLVAVAASALVIGAAGGVLGSRVFDTKPAARQQVVAQVALQNIQPAVTHATGSASVVRTGGGQRLVLTVSKLAPMPGHFYDVWLIDPKITKMVSLGILDGTTGQFVIPDGVDVSAYPIVDISVQQPGDPKHSGDSVLRGVIKT